MYQNIGKLYICGDFNARCGDIQDFIEGVDNVQKRHVIDDVSNRNGDLPIEFLVDCNMCMLNGRTGSHDFTNISSKGKSVVDYVLTPYEQICDVVDFRVHTMSDVVTRLDLLRYESVPDHSLLEWIIGSQMDVANVDEKPNEKKRIQATRKFRMEGLNVNELFADENTIALLCETIDRMEDAIERRRDVDDAFVNLKHLLIRKMELTCREVKHNVMNRRSHKCNRKPYWNDELQETWKRVCDAEKDWKRCESNAKRRLRAIFVQRRKDFDKLNR
jgi:hypothetical protein